MKKKILFIINPISGDTKKANIPALIARDLDNKQYDYTIQFTEHAGHATFLANQAVVDGFNIVVAVGGDGSVALIHTDVALGIIPMGSGNGLASHLQIPIRNAQKAIQVLNYAKIERIDVAWSSYGYFISCAGIGLEAQTARTYRHQLIRGFISYFWAIIKTVLFIYRSKDNVVDFEVDGVKREEAIYLFTVFNSRFFGYEVGFAPKASLQDGKLDLVFVKSIAVYRIPILIFLGLIKKLHLLREAEFLSIEKLRIPPSKKRVAQLDGDSFIASNTFELAIEKAALNVIIHQNAKPI